MTTRMVALVLLLARGGFAWAGSQDAPPLPEYTIQRAAEPIQVDGQLDEASWRNAKSVGDFVFPWPAPGKQHQTKARLLWDDENLYVSFVARDEDIESVLTERDTPVSEEDCVEVFVAPNPERVEDYFNFEINALGTLFDRAPFDNHNKAWNAAGIRIAVARKGTINNAGDTDEGWTTEMAIPFAVFQGVAKTLPPREGDHWRLNLYRIDGQEPRHYGAWSSPATPGPNYHVPRRFGVVRFSAAPAGQAG